MIPVKNETLWPKTVGAVTPRRKVYELTKQLNKQTTHSDGTNHVLLKASRG